MNLTGLILGVYGVMSVATFIVYGIDKGRAERGAWRIPERTLHLLELFFGWPGALIAQQFFKHKRRKTGFMVIFVLIVGVHLALAIGVLRLRGII